MHLPRVVKGSFLAGVLAASLCALPACSEPVDISGVAAVVNGVEIMEPTVTEQVEQIRAQAGLSDDDTWGSFLVQNDMTPSSVRENVIDTLTEKELIKEAAGDLEITVEDSEVDESINTFKENFKSDDSWKTALENAGFTEESYREEVYESLIEQKVSEHFEETAETTDEDYVSSLQTYASYYDGAKRSSHILFTIDDENDSDAVLATRETAESVLQQINDGTLDFAEAAKQYSEDESSAENGGDVGWDKLNSFVDEYTDALDELELDQVSDLVQSEYGFHIIKVTDVYNAPDSSEITSLDQIPEEFQSNIKSMASSVSANTAYSDWLDGVKESAEIEIKDMPKGLPYDIDLTPYQTEDEDDEDATDDEDEDEDADLTDTDSTEIVSDELESSIDLSEDNSSISETTEATSEESSTGDTTSDEASADATSATSTDSTENAS